MTPWISIEPESRSQKSSRHLINVVLPAPFKPARPRHLPEGTSRSIPAQHVGAPEALVHSAESYQRLGHKADKPFLRLRR